MKSRGVMIATIILLIIIIIALISMMIIAIVGKDKNYKVSFFAFGNKTKTLFQSEYNIEDIEKIAINSNSSNVKFVESQADKVKVTIYGIDGEEYNVNLNDKLLQIDKTNAAHFVFAFFFFARQEVIIELPKEYAGEVRNTII